MWRHTNILLTLPLILQDRGLNTSQCPPDFTFQPTSASCYLVVQTVLRNHSEAYTACAEHGATVHLVAIETAAEMANVGAFLSQYNGKT